MHMCSKQGVFFILFLAHAYPTSVPLIVQQEITKSTYHRFFEPIELPFTHEKVITEPRALLNAARNAYAHLTSEHGMKEYAYIVRNNYSTATFDSKKLFTPQAKETLTFIITTLEEDLAHNRPSRLCNTDFLNKNFTFLSWLPDKTMAAKQGVLLDDDKKIRTTKYLVFKMKGSKKKTADYPHALYHLNDKHDSLRFSFTKQDIIKNIFEQETYKKKVKPLVWLSRYSLEEALLQGTIHITYDDGTSDVFTVDKNNGIAYDKTIKEKMLQKRYWYFKKVPPLTQRPLTMSYIINHPEITLAGDILNIGLGKVIVLRYSEPTTEKVQLRIGLLTDTGGAFINNAYQLDQFAGFFNTREEFFASTKHLPEYAQAFIIIKKQALTQQILPQQAGPPLFVAHHQRQ